MTGRLSGRGAIVTGSSGIAAATARRFAAELGHQVNETLNEKRWSLVLGATAQSITTLHTLPPQAEPPAPASFAKLLNKERGNE